MAVDNKAVANATTASIISANELFTIYPEILPDLYYNYGEGMKVFDILRYAMKGREELISSETYTAHEQNYPYRTVTMHTCVVAQAGGAAATFTLDASDLDTSNRYFIRKYDTLLLGDVTTGLIGAWVENVVAVGATVTVTIRPQNINDILSATYVYDGAVCPITGNAWAVETDSNTPTHVGFNELTYFAQIMKASIKFGGMELARKKWAAYDGNRFFNDEIARVELHELDAWCEMAMLVGQETTNTAITQASSVDSATNRVRTNKGIWQLGGTYGKDVTFTGAGSFAITDFDAVAQYFETKGITNTSVLFTMGGDLMRRIEASAVGYITGTSGGLNWLFTPDAGGGDKNLEVGFSHIKKAGITFLLHSNPIFNNSYYLGAKTLLFKDAGLMFPINYVKDGKTGLDIPNLSIKYCGLRTYNRKRVVGMFPGMDGYMQQAFKLPTISTIDANTVNWLTHVSFPYVEAWKTVRVYRTS
jgi:hypothetical protein